MKNQYFGDVGDYGKYAMLRYLNTGGQALEDSKIFINFINFL